MTAPARTASLTYGIAACRCTPRLASHPTHRLAAGSRTPMHAVRRPQVRRLATAVDLPVCAKPPLYGQPMPDTHPHLMSNGELTPGITLEEYHTRRKTLMDSLPEKSVVIAVGGKIKYMSQGIFYKFRQASDFWYLTGFEEPDSAVILEKTSKSKGYRMTLFVHPKDKRQELWEGACTGIESAITRFGADAAHPLEDFPTVLRTLISPTVSENVYVDGSLAPKGRAKRGIFDFLTKGPKGDYEGILSAARTRIRELAPELGKMRAVKSKAEQRVMRKSGEISGRAHAKTMTFTADAQTEAQLAAHFEFQCATQGAQRPAYVPVVASGANARIIHYVKNDCTMQPGELILMDAGAEYNGYASDITRTWPVNGKFTEPQRDLYQAVLNVEKACIELCTAEAGLSLNDLHRRSCELLRQELLQLGFSLKSADVDRILYPHFLSHPIGIDLHESSTIDRSKPLQSGNAITIEPGVYVPPADNFPKHFHNIGIRIEDCVLVQPDSSIILSIEAPKEIADVEGACQRLLQ